MVLIHLQICVGVTSNSLVCFPKYRYPLFGSSQSGSSTFGIINFSASTDRDLSSLPRLSHSRFDNTTPSAEVLELWRNADAVCFDVDSTVCLDEGIDELADFCGFGKAVSEWTSRAMSGSVPFEDALAARLSLFKPSLSQLQDFLHQRPPRLSPSIVELMKELKANNRNIYLISGGFRQMIDPIASILRIPPEYIFANRLLFETDGDFLGFDRSEPTARSGGKTVVVRKIKKIHGYRTVVMIGDGATDLEAGADLFICYAGVHFREGVASKSDWVIYDFGDLITSLPPPHSSPIMM